MFKNMHFISHVFLFFCFLSQNILTEAHISDPYHSSADEGTTLNCGFSGKYVALDGREWVGDTELEFSKTQRSNRKAVISTAPYPFSADPVPYMTARISRSKFIYSFPVKPGQKFIRLHFHSASYPGFERSDAFFTVKVGPYTLLGNFSASFYSDALGKTWFTREYCINVEDSQVLSLTFIPSHSSSSSNVYAFVNGIEIISMPTGLYYTPDGDPGARVVGQKHRFHVDQTTALELVHRLNVGGGSILPVEDLGLFRRWSTDSSYLSEPSVLPLTTATPVKCTSIPTYIAPQKVYQTAWSIDLDRQRDEMCNLTWNLPVDIGFRYLVRLHLCELDYGINDIGERKFGIFINKKTAEADLIEWSGRNGVAVYRDYVVMMDGNRMEGTRDLNIALQPKYYGSNPNYHTGAVVSGIEVFKLSNPDNNLAGQNPDPPAIAPTLKFKKLLLMCGNGNTLVGTLIILATTLNIIVYKLRVWAEEFNNKDACSSSKSEDLCREFSLSEMLLATNNFDDSLVIGDGGFGNVYKGVIDKGTSVAVKRLKPMSKQGSEEFWTEIKLLSTLRHTHLVTLIGYCNESNEMILVYDYMIHGTLADHLYKMKRSDGSFLSLEQRLNICIGAAHGLEYLHTGAEHRVIHRDVKSTNILLDENLVAKISDFGLSKVGGQHTNHASTYMITDVKGTFGYLDVEYFLTHRLSRKSDVYAFGVVLFEVLCGRPAVDKRFEGAERSLAVWAQSCIKDGKLDQIIDLKIKEEISPHCLKVFAEVAQRCLGRCLNDRPRMSEVVQRLKFALASQNTYSSTDTEAEQKEISMMTKRPVKKGQEAEIEEPSASTNAPKEKANKKTISKMFQNITKGMDLRRRMTISKDLSSSPPWFWSRARSIREGRSLLLENVTTLSCRQFSVREILDATNNFHRNLVISYGGSGGQLYRGYIDDGESEVAIERCVRESGNKFLTEVETRSRLNHLHIVSFYGYCQEPGETILVYKYMVRGSFSSYLYGTGKNHLPWKKRLEICIAAARGLQYIHSMTPEPIIHGDLKSSSILLDDKWIAKISGLKGPMFDRGNNMARTVVTRVVRETVGYMDPEYLLCGNLTTKSDVYSFGVVLLEVLSGREALCYSLGREQRKLAQWFQICVQRNHIDEFIDPNIIVEVVPECLTKFTTIAESCLHFRGTERKSMDDVVGSLESALKLQEAVDNV